MNKLRWIWFLFFPVSLVAQEIRPLAYWQFESEDSWREDDRKQHKMGGFSYAKVIESGGLAGSFLQIPQNELNQMDVTLDISDAITIEFLFRFPEYEFNSQNMMFWFVDKRVYTAFNYPKFDFRTKTKTSSGEIIGDGFNITLDGSGKNSYNYYVDHKWHHVVFKFDAKNGKKELWIDGELPEGFSKDIAARGTICGTPTCDSKLFFGMPASYKLGFAGDIDEVAIYDRFIPESIHVRHYQEIQSGKPYSFSLRSSKNPQPTTRNLKPATVQIDPREYQPAHPNIGQAPIDQLRKFPRPRYLPNNNLFRLYNWMELPYLGGINAPGTSYYQAVQNSVLLQEELALNWNYIIGLQNSKIASSDKELKNTDRFLGAWIELANRHPEIPLSVTTFWAQINHKSVGEDRSLPYIYRQDLPTSYYFQDANKKLLRPNGTPVAKQKHLSFAAKGDAFKKDGTTQKYYLDRIVAELTRPITIINENGEVQPYPFHGNKVEIDPAMVRHKKALGISDWETYQARQKTRFRALYSDEFIKKTPSLTNTLFTWYGIDGGPQTLNRFNWEDARTINSKINGQYYSTPDLYPRWPHNWRMNAGAWHGWEWIRMTRGVEILAGDKLFSPFVAAGWHRDPEKNVRPSQWLGLLKNLGVVGAEFYYTGFFNEGNGKNILPNPGHYIWQAAMPAYAQAITSRYEEILREGDLLLDDKGNPIINHWAGGEHILVSIRKHNTQPIYVLAGTVQPNSNMIGNVPDEAQATIRFDGHQLKCKVRRQGSVYVYDLRDSAKPVFYQLDKWHESGHPYRWSKDFAFEAEVFDMGQHVGIRTEKPEGRSAEDFTEYTTYLQANDKQAQVAYDFTVTGNENDHLTLEMKMRALDRKEGKVQLYLDGQKAGDPLCIKDTSWEWFTGKKLEFTNLKKGQHTLSVQLLNTYIQLDQLLLRAK